MSYRQFFTTAQATRIAGFNNPMMVEYLARAGVVVPSARPAPGRGRPKLYVFGDLVILRAVRRLLEAGVQVSKLKSALKTYRTLFYGLEPDSSIAKYLITDGKNVLLRDDPKALVELSKDGQLAFAFIVDLCEAKETTKTQLDKFEGDDCKFPKAVRKRNQNVA